MKKTHRWLVIEAVVLTAGGVAGWSAGCAAGNSDTVLGPDGGPVTSDGGATFSPDGGAGTVAACTPCLSNGDCRSEVCAQIQGDSFCAPSCSASGVCPAGSSCQIESAYNGQQVSVCVPETTCPGGASSSGGAGGGGGGAGGGGVGGSTGGGGGAGTGGGSTGETCVPAASNCGGYAAPSTPSTCKSCSASSSSCQPNGCYGGWYCDESTSKCHEPPAGCSAGGGTTCSTGGGGGGGGGGSGGSASSSRGGGASSSGSGPTSVTGTVTGAGGSVSSLLFAIAGDTRPANEDDTSGYPTTIIDTIFTSITARSPQPTFVVSTGDYVYANPTGSQAAPQQAKFMSARAKFPGAWFPAMGNHECTGYTASNCGSGNADGVTNNYTGFLQTMLGPINQTKPYYVIKVNATDGSWTSKFVFVAANAWDSTQSSWLESTLAESTTYTFVLRHEANEANTAPGTDPSEAIITQHPLTLEICGHTHNYSKSGNRVVFGNGGAPLTGSSDYGYGIVTQLSNGNLTVDEIDYQTGAADSSFHFEVTPTGTVQ